jgi:hypothetical protein
VCFNVQVCSNPSQPLFNHYLFETLAALLRTVVTASPSPSVVDQFEALLFPTFQAILQRDIAEFLPYVFQLLGQLLLLRKPAVGGASTSLVLHRVFASIDPVSPRPSFFIASCCVSACRVACAAKEVVLSAAYLALFPSLLAPALWNSRGNVPGLVTLLCVRALAIGVSLCTPLLSSRYVAMRVCVTGLPPPQPVPGPEARRLGPDSRRVSEDDCVARD